MCSVFALAAILSLTACKNAESPLIGSWQVTSATWGGVEIDINQLIENVKKIAPEMAEAFECAKNSSANLYKDHTYNVTSTGTCKADQLGEKGTWSYNDKDKTVTVKSDGGESVTLTYSNGKLSFTQDGTTVYFTKK